VLGSGVQAYWQVLALHHERPFEQLTIWARDPKKANCLRERLHALLDRVSITVGRDLQETVHEADVILTATLARDPLVRGEWLRPGQHITAIGADDATKCELHASVLHRARVFVDDTGTAVRNGDVYHAIQAGGYCAEMLAGSIGEVLSGRKVGRTTPEEITLAKFVGIGAQDLVAAEVALAMLNLSSTDEKRSIGADPRNHYFPGSIRLPQ
jgi:ornithine cyclodeaminase